MFSTDPGSGEARGDCDRCNARIQSGDGFLFYSACEFGLPGRSHLLGAIFYCADCTDRLFGPEHWQRTGVASAEDRLRELAERPQVRDDTAPLRDRVSAFLIGRRPPIKDDSESINAAIDDAYADSVIARCRLLRMTPETARAEASRWAKEVWQVASMPDPDRTDSKAQLDQKAAFNHAMGKAEAFWRACDSPVRPALADCYYCGRPSATAGKHLEVVNERVLNRRVSDHGTAYLIQRRSLTIPRCAECEKS